ncbi:MAG: chromate transporter [Oscillochloris sp.]|nr:chromate transporter [Oscillochloris sp.]
MNPLIFFLLMLRSSFFSTSGLGNLPQLYDDLISRDWATEQTFAEALAVGQISPGPSGLWVISLGYLLDGPRGVLLATLAIVIPPAGVLVLDRIYRRIGGHPAMEGFVRGLSLAVVGVFLVTLGDLLQNSGIAASTLLIAACSYGLAISGRVPVIVILALAAAAGILVFGV